MSASQVPSPEDEVATPYRDLPATGDDTVDAVLVDFAAAAQAPLADQLAAAERAHRALQDRLGG